MPNIPTTYLLNGRNVNTPGQYCRGDGYTLGLTNGSANCSLASAGGGSIYPQTGDFHVPVTISPVWNTNANNGAYGLTTIASYSGVYRDAITSTISDTVSFKACIKY